MFIQMYKEKYIRFPGGKAKAVTFSYDDGVEADKRLLSIFKKYGLKGTFNLNNLLFDCQCWHNRMDEADAAATFKGCGQEVAMHGARHLFLEKVTLPEIVKEVADNRSYLEDTFGGIVRGMAYAYGSTNADIRRVLKDLGVAYARTTKSTYSFDIPSDWLELNPTCHHCEPEFAQIAERFFTASPLDEVKHREGWLFYIWGHAYEFDDDNNWEVIEDVARRAKAQADEIWHATNIEVYEYVQAYNSLVFSLDGERAYNPSAIPVWIEARGKTYKIDAGRQVQFDK